MPECAWFQAGTIKGDVCNKVELSIIPVWSTHILHRQRTAKYAEKECFLMGQQHHHCCRRRRSRIKTKNVLHPNQIIAKSDLLSLRIPLVETNGAIIFHIRSVPPLLHNKNTISWILLLQHFIYSQHELGELQGWCGAFRHFIAKTNFENDLCVKKLEKNTTYYEVF